MTYVTAIESTTQLTYALVTDPAPLQVSLAGTDASTADVQLVITNQQSAAVTVKVIEIVVVVGAGADALTDLTTAALDVQWQPHDPWEVQAPQLGAGDNTYTLLASDAGTGVLEVGDSIVVTFADVPVNQVLGTALLSVTERTQLGGGGVQYALSKFPYGFSFANLRVTDPQNQATILSQVPHGGTVRLLWDGSVLTPASYSVLYSTAAGEQSTPPVTTVGQWDSPALTEDAVFNVEVTVNDVSGVPVTHVLTTSVAVAQPDLSVSSINLGGQDLAGQLALMAQSLVPKGTITMWSGAASAIPAGWALCDGTQGTPDLRNRFILGADPVNGPQPQATGGSASHTHTATATVGIAMGGDHTHGVPEPWYSNTASSGKGVTIVDRDATEAHNAQTQTAGEHTHEATAMVYVDPTDTLPPWYALCFIIKVI